LTSVSHHVERHPSFRRLFCLAGAAFALVPDVGGRGRGPSAPGTLQTAPARRPVPSRPVLGRRAHPGSPLEQMPVARAHPLRPPRRVRRPPPSPRPTSGGPVQAVAGAPSLATPAGPVQAGTGRRSGLRRLPRQAAGCRAPPAAPAKTNPPRGRPRSPRRRSGPKLPGCSRQCGPLIPDPRPYLTGPGGTRCGPTEPPSEPRPGIFFLRHAATPR